MVHEVRRIILCKEEMLSALAAHNRQTPGFLPAGKIVDFDIINQTNIMVIVETEPLSQEASVIFPDTKLVQALIRFCIENNIMLPREGHKSVVVDKESVALCITLDTEAYLMSGMEPLCLSSYAIS